MYPYVIQMSPNLDLHYLWSLLTMIISSRKFKYTANQYIWVNTQPNRCRKTCCVEYPIDRRDLCTSLTTSVRNVSATLTLKLLLQISAAPEYLLTPHNVSGRTTPSSELHRLNETSLPPDNICPLYEPTRRASSNSIQVCRHPNKADDDVDAAPQVDM